MVKTSKFKRFRVSCLAGEELESRTVLSSYSCSLDLPDVPVLADTELVATPAQHSEDMQFEHDYVFARLINPSEATIVAAASGDWSSTQTWGDRLPIAGDKVLITSGVVVTVDSVMDDVTYQWIRVEKDGELRFATDSDTALKVDTLVSLGAFTMGTVSDPIGTAYTARLIFSGTTPIDRAWDPLAMSRGAIFHGVVEIAGSPKTPFVAVPVALAGATTLRVAGEVPADWMVGDQIVLTGARHGQEELRTIVAAGADEVTIDASLLYDHIAPAGQTFHLANLTRNAVLESEAIGIKDPLTGKSDITRNGHVMFMHSSSVRIAYAASLNGRTDKSIALNSGVLTTDGSLQPGTGVNPSGRYGWHFHKSGTDPSVPPATIAGSVSLDSSGWGFVNHGGNVAMTCNVGYRNFGADFVAEDGNEVGLMQGNLAIGSAGYGQDRIARDDTPGEQSLGHKGNGYWLQSAGVILQDNIAAGHQDVGFAWWTEPLLERSRDIVFTAVSILDPTVTLGRDSIPVSDVPIQASGLVSYGSRKEGVGVWFHRRHSPESAPNSVIQDVVVWGVSGTEGMTNTYGNRITYRNVRIIGDGESNRYQRGTGMSSGGGANTSDLIFDNLQVTGWQVGATLPARGQHNVVRGGYYDNDINFSISTLRAPPSRKVEFYLDESNFADGFRFQLGTVDKLSSPTLDYIFMPDVLYLNDKQLFFAAQMPDYVFPSTFGIPEYRGMTAQQVWDLYGRAVGGMLAPLDAYSIAGIRNGFVA